MTATPQQWQRDLKPDPSVLELLDKLQAAARRGHIRALAVVVINPLLETEVGSAGGIENVKKHILLGGLWEAGYKLLGLLP